MQGLGSAPLSLAAGEQMRSLWLPRVGAGSRSPRFALSEPGAAPTSRRCRRRRGSTARIRAGRREDLDQQRRHRGLLRRVRAHGAGSRRPDGSVSAEGISAFVVKPGDSGFTIAERIDAMAPHRSRARLRGMPHPGGAPIGAEGEGFKIAMRTLDVFRTSVAAARLRLRAARLNEAPPTRARGTVRQAARRLPADAGGARGMATALDAATLLTYRAAWLRDTGAPSRRGRDGEAARRRRARRRSSTGPLQIFGGRGLVQGAVVERLYREIRALRIYEGASEVQKLIVARELLK
jgi:alkylation response protein AidB-like acyl-CoA dehydrogenase